MNMLRWNRGCVYVCVCLCMCVTALQPKRLDGFRWNFPQMIWQIFARSVFLGFWNFETMTSWRPFCTFSFAALSRSQFCFDCLQNLTQDRMLPSTVCYLKSAKSVGNFCQYAHRVSKNPQTFFFEIGQVRCWLLADHENENILSIWLKVSVKNAKKINF